MAVVHDYLSQRGGAERVALAMLQVFPTARLITSVYDADRTFQDFRRYGVEVLHPHRSPLLRRDPRAALPLLLHAFARADIDDVDVVLCSSSGFAHSVGTRAPKVVYCHNPARWLYQTDDYLGHVPRAVQMAFGLIAKPLRQWDRRAALEANTYLVNSRAVRERVRVAYGIDATLLPPPLTLDPAGRVEPVPGVEPGFLLTVGRMRGYKNTSVVAEAVAGMPSERLLAVGGLPPGAWPSRLQGLTGINDGQLRWLYQNADALVACSYEDFGLTPVEAYSHGLPAITLAAGGYLDTTAEGITGPSIAAPPTAGGVRDAIDSFRSRDWDSDLIRQHAERWSFSRFATGLRAVVDREVHVSRSPHSTPARANRMKPRTATVVRGDRRRIGVAVDEERRR